MKRLGAFLRRIADALDPRQEEPPVYYWPSERFDDWQERADKAARCEWPTTPQRPGEPFDVEELPWIKCSGHGGMYL